MPARTDQFLTALAPAVWGSTYLVTTEFLPDGYPVTVAMLRALPAGLLLLIVVRQLPPRVWLWKVLVLGALNFSIFWVLLFIAAYRLPGGVAATVGAIQPLIVIFLAQAVLGTTARVLPVLAAIAGMGGVALLVLTPDAQLDLVGVAAGLGGAVSMAAGTVLSRKWQPPVSLLTFTAWQLAAGGLLLLPLSLWSAAPRDGGAAYPHHRCPGCRGGRGGLWRSSGRDANAGSGLLPDGHPLGAIVGVSGERQDTDV